MPEVLQTTPTPPSAEVVAAQTLMKQLGTVTEGMSGLSERVKELAKKVEGFEKLDVAKVLEEVDKMVAHQKEFERRVRNDKGGFHFPGIEDVGKKFSLLKAMLGFMAGSDQGFEKIAPFEHEVIKTARSAVEKAGAGHVIGVDSTAGVFIPDQVLSDVISAIYTKSVLVSLVAGEGQTRVTTLDGLFGIPVKIPRIFGGMEAYWIGEEDDYIESRMTSGVETMTPKKMGVLASITDEMRRFPAPTFDAMMRYDISRAAAKKIDWTIFYGSGSADMPLGIINRNRHDSTVLLPNGQIKPGINYYYAQSKTGGPDVSAPVSPTGAELDFDDLSNMQGVLEDLDLETDESWAWISHPRYFRRLKQRKVSQFSGQTDEKSYLLGAPMISEARLRDVIGDFGKSTQIISNRTLNGSAKYGDVVGANWREVLFGRWSGIELTNDDGKGSGFKKDITNIKLRMYADVGCREERSIVYCPDAKMRD